MATAAATRLVGVDVQEELLELGARLGDVAAIASEDGGAMAGHARCVLRVHGAIVIAVDRGRAVGFAHLSAAQPGARAVV